MSRRKNSPVRSCAYEAVPRRRAAALRVRVRNDHDSSAGAEDSRGVAREEPPKVDFPLPSQSTSAAPGSVNDPDFNVEVQEQHANVETRRQVSADGLTIENIPRNGGTAVVAERRPAREDARRSTTHV